MGGGEAEEDDQLGGKGGTSAHAGQLTSTLTCSSKNISTTTIASMLGETAEMWMQRITFV